MLHQSLVHAVCPVCRADLPRRVAVEGPFGIVRCAVCAVLYVTPRLAEPQGHYHGEREAVLRKYGPILRAERGHNRDPNYAQELGVLRRLKPEGRLLDIGTHCGFFLRHARGLGWSLTGVEPSPIGALLAREFYGLDVKTATLHEAAFPDRSFDVVTMVDVFEHVGEPIETLSEVRRILRDDGLLFIKVPNGRYSLFKYRLIRLAMGLRQVEIFDAKEHVVHYTADTLTKVLASGGFRIRTAFVPLPIQDGAAWKCALRSTAYRLARIQRALGGGFGPLATDVAVVAEKAPNIGTPRPMASGATVAAVGREP